MMSTQFELLRKLVIEELCLANGTSGNTNTGQWLAALPGITTELFIAMRNEVFSEVNDRLIERHIKQTQEDCIYLMDVLLQQKNTMPAQFIALYEATFNCLQEILDYIGHHHARFFNLQAIIPTGYFKASVSEMQQKVAVLKAGFKKKKVEEILQDLVLNSLSDFINDASCTYERLIYMQGLQTSLIRLCNEERDDFNEALREQLLYFRFNTNSFAAYYRSRIAHEISEIYNAEEQFERLCQYEKQFKVQQERASGCFELLNISLRCLLLEYVKAEMKYLLKRQSLLQKQPADLNRRLQNGTYRIKVSLSVDALAYLVRLHVEAGVIVVGTKTELMAFLARSFQTPGIGDKMLSSASLLNKYKQVVQTTAKAVRAALVRMLKILDEGFGYA